MKLVKMFHPIQWTCYALLTSSTDDMQTKFPHVYLLFTFNLSSNTAGDSGTGGEMDVERGVLSSSPSSNTMQLFCLTNIP